MCMGMNAVVLGFEVGAVHGGEACGCALLCAVCMHMRTFESLMSPSWTPSNLVPGYMFDD